MLDGRQERLVAADAPDDGCEVRGGEVAARVPVGDRAGVARPAEGLLSGARGKAEGSRAHHGSTALAVVEHGRDGRQLLRADLRLERAQARVAGGTPMMEPPLRDEPSGRR